MKKTPRPHQLRGLDELRAGFRRGDKRGLLVVPTGGGKTFVAMMMADGSIQMGRRVVFVADRRVLVSQAATAARDFGLPVGIVMSDAPWGWYHPDAPLQVMSKDTAVAWLKAAESGKRKPELPPADLIVVDESHRGSGQSWEFLRAAYPSAWEVGLSATPVYPNGTGMGRRYDFLVNPASYAELQAAGVLMKPTCYAPGNRVQKGAKKPSRATLVGDVVFWWRKYADGLRTFVFACDVAHSLALEDEFRKAGIPARHVDGQTPDAERDEAFKKLATGELLVVVNCNVCRYGVDVPQAECCQLVAPMTSLVDYRQSVGRVLRTAPGKSKAVVIDHAAAILYHGFPDADLPWTLDGGTDHVKRQRERMEAGEAPKPVACPECGTLFSGRPDCPSCGWRPRKQPKAKGTAGGVLTEVEREAVLAGADPGVADRVWRAKVAIAANRGLKVTAAAAMFKKELGRWPEGFVSQEHLPPTRSDWSKPAAEVYPGYVRRTGAIL